MLMVHLHGLVEADLFMQPCHKQRVTFPDRAAALRRWLRNVCDAFGHSDGKTSQVTVALSCRYTNQMLWR